MNSVDGVDRRSSTDAKNTNCLIVINKYHGLLPVILMGLLVVGVVSVLGLFIRRKAL